MTNSHRRALLLAACLAPGQGSAQGVANPAVQRCFEDGYQPRAVYRGGVPVDFLCQEPASGASCPIWSYYRGECRLTDPRRSETQNKE